VQTTPSGPGNGLHDDVRSDGDGGQVQDKAQEFAGQAQDKAQEVAGQAKGRAQQMVDERSSQAGEQVSKHAGDLKSVGDALRQQGQDGPAKLADQAAQRVERVGSYLSESDADRIVSDVEDLARKNPWAVALGGLALGFAASRFLKASSRERAVQSRDLSRLPAQTGPSSSSDRGFVGAGSV
jgi:uncharacterized protein YfiM (DUF2279 family)